MIQATNLEIEKSNRLANFSGNYENYEKLTGETVLLLCVLYTNDMIRQTILSQNNLKTFPVVFYQLKAKRKHSGSKDQRLAVPLEHRR